MKLLLFPEVEPARLELIREAAGEMQVANAPDVETALDEITDADAFFGKITAELLSAAEQLQWVQSPTASLEHYLFDELVEHPCKLSNMRGLFSDVIADHVMGYVICLARNLHLYVRQQMATKWEPIGGEAGRSTFTQGPHAVSNIDRAHLHLSDCSIGVIGVGKIGAEICRRASAFGMTVRGVDPICREVPGAVADVWPTERLLDLLAASDFVVIAAPHTPETYKLFQTEQFRQMKPSA